MFRLIIILPIILCASFVNGLPRSEAGVKDFHFRSIGEIELPLRHGSDNVCIFNSEKDLIGGINCANGETLWRKEIPDLLRIDCASNGPICLSINRRGLLEAWLQNSGKFIWSKRIAVQTGQAHILNIGDNFYVAIPGRLLKIRSDGAVLNEFPIYENLSRFIKIEERFFIIFESSKGVRILELNKNLKTIRSDDLNDKWLVSSCNPRSFNDVILIADKRRRIHLYDLYSRKIINIAPEQSTSTLKINSISSQDDEKILLVTEEGGEATKQRLLRLAKKKNRIIPIPLEAFLDVKQEIIDISCSADGSTAILTSDQAGANILLLNFKNADKPKSIVHIPGLRPKAFQTVEDHRFTDFDFLVKSEDVELLAVKRTRIIWARNEIISKAQEVAVVFSSDDLELSNISESEASSSNVKEYGLYRFLRLMILPKKNPSYIFLILTREGTIVALAHSKISKKHFNSRKILWKSRVNCGYSFNKDHYYVNSEMPTIELKSADSIIEVDIRNGEVTNIEKSLERKTESESSIALNGCKLTKKQSDEIIWSISLPGDACNAVSNVNSAISSAASKLADHSILFKYINRQAFAVSAVCNTKLLVSIVDGYTGNIIRSFQHDEILTKEPIAMAFDENAFIYSFKSRKMVQGNQFVSVNLYQDAKSSFSTSYGNIFVSSKSFIVPFEVTNMRFTRTNKGIAQKNIIAYSKRLRQLIMIRKDYIEPRRPNIYRQSLTSSENAEGFIEYEANIPIGNPLILSHENDLVGIQNVTTLSTFFESTSLTVAFGLDFFYSLTEPSNAFDKLDADFNQKQVLITLAILISALIYTRSRVRKRKSVKRWDTI